MKTLILISCALLATLCSSAQTTPAEVAADPGKAGGVYYAYPVTESLNTPAPAGYEPFYISHYGRHGSRYLISDEDYSKVRATFHKAAEAGVLTPLGLDVMARLDSLWAEAEGRGGELSPLGRRQHHDIATRMYTAFPQVFAPGADMYASSTTIMRCAHSMFAFIEGLKEQAPYLDIPRESGNRNMYFLNYHSPESGWYTSHDGPTYQPWKRFREQLTQPSRLVSSLFTDPQYVNTWIDPVDLMWQLYWVTVDTQNMETQVELYDIFTEEELYNLWQVFNFHFFSRNSSYAPAEGHFVANADNLINNIVSEADRVIAAGRHGATLRFGHDGNIVPLTARMGLENCYTDETDPYKLASVWTDFKISPMASNLQIVFFRNPAGGDILAKLMLNEREISVPLATDTYPFYPWPALRSYLLDIVNQ